MNRFNIKQPVVISNSYLQDNRHQKVSDKFNVIQASSVGQVMANHGLNLVNLKTGRGRLESTIDFQSTISRYRNPNPISFDSNGKAIFLDVIYQSKHMGRGQDRVYIGIYREICTNGMQAGYTFFERCIRHSGDTFIQLNDAIVAALAMAGKLGE